MQNHTINNQLVKRFTIKQIFRDHWDSFQSAMEKENKPIRQVIKDEVKKVIGCGDPKNGYHIFICFLCHAIKHVFFTCKSRFCNSCGAKYAKDRALSISSKIVDKPHRHVVFTIPKELRKYFAHDRALLNILFKASSETVSYFFSKRSKLEDYVPGMICVLHTFGRDLKWNPHIHMILSEGAIGNITPWRDFNHINYENLRRSWQYLLLKYLLEAIPTPDFKALVDKLYLDDPDGFYVNAPPSKKTYNASAVVTYVVRYTGRPVMAQSRISNYDGSNVTFWYKPHGADSIVTETISAFDFIKKLIIHIPDHNFKMIRYYGFYCVRNRKHQAYLRLTKKSSATETDRLKNIFKSWAKRIVYFFRTDPLRCTCGGYFEFLDTFLPKPYKNESSVIKHHEMTFT